MKRLIEKTVFCELVTAWRFAACPTSRSPLFVNATTDGVVRAPSEFSKTTGSPPSITDMQELVVPKSIPKTFAIKLNCLSWVGQLADKRPPAAARLLTEQVFSKGSATAVPLWLTHL